MLIEKTEGYCVTCGTTHPADITRRGGEVYFQLNCPRRPAPVKISSDADIFLGIRHLHNDMGPQQYRWINAIEITSACNFRCPVCYASADDVVSAPHFRGVAEVIGTAKRLRKSGIRNICLTGGEPSIHPDICRIVENVRRLGLRVSMATNGYVLGKDQGLAAELKSAGLRMAHIQFDTFDPETHVRLRGNDFVPVKKQAVENCISAGLRFSLIATITADNLHEVPDILDYAVDRIPHVNNVTFNCASQGGRFEYDAGRLVNREDVIHRIVDSGRVAGIGPHSFRPVPSFMPWRLSLHPDCAAMLLLLKLDGKLVTFSRIADVDLLDGRLRKCRAKSNFVTRNAVPLAYLLNSLRPGGLRRLVRAAMGSITRRSSDGMLMVFAEQFMNHCYMDMARLSRCTSVIHRMNGSATAPCAYDIPRLAVTEGGRE
ncbi:MAG: radical SAM protein [Planctomycetes bacterium]|nr:radical SAM protein [Planctomycetota bacterium]